MPRLDRIDAEYTRELDEAAIRFGDHEGMTRGRILGWLGQFADEHLELATTLLSEIRYYSAANIRAMIGQLVAMVRARFPDIPPQRIWFVPAGDLGSSAGIIARALRDVRPRPQIIAFTDMEALPPADVEAIVFVDDFSGTGDQLAEWWANVEPLVLPKNATVVVGLLVMNYLARAVVEAFAEAMCVRELDETEDVFRDANTTFSAGEKDALLAYCRRTRSRAEYLRGKGACGLLVAFRHGCPNNSLPILWHENRVWRGLFRRSGL